MEYIHKIKKMLCKELEGFSNKEKLAGVELEMVWKLSDTIKNLEKIMMLTEEEEEGNSRNSYGSYDDDMSYRRGRGRYAKRDSMGRYSREGGYSEEGDSFDSYDSYDSYGSSRSGNSMRGSRDSYSRDGGRDHMMNKLGKMMGEADEEQREVLKKCMRELEKI